MQVYRITGWDKHFENNRTRELKVLSWVPFPNKHDGDGYTELLDHKDAAAHFGCWCAIVEVASKCDPRGTLLRDGQNGVKKPHNAASLSRMTRISEKVLRSAIERLVDIGWITIYDDPALGCDLSAALGCASRARVPEGKEGKGREGKEGNTETEIPVSLNTPEFMKAWENWQQHRREIKKPLTDQSIKMQMADFQKWGAERAIAAIEFTIKKGWQGIRETDVKATGNPTFAATRKPFPGEVLKLLDELRTQKSAMWNRYSFNGEIPADKPTVRQEYTELCRRVKELEKQARII